MNAQQLKALAVVMALLGITAVVLVRFSAVQKLGAPGVKVVAEPTYVTGGKVVRTESVHLPIAVPEFASEAVEITPIEVSWLPQDTLFGRRLYHAKDGFLSWVSVVLMGTDRTSIHKPQFCLDGQGWHIDKSETVVIPISRPYPYELRAMKLTASKPVLDGKGQPAKAQGIYVYWFVSENLLTPFHGERMWWMARELIRTGVLQRWAYISFLTVCWPGQEEMAYNRLRDLISASVPEFQLAAGASSPVRTTAALTTEVSK